MTGAAVALHFMYYNFVRIHQTLRVTPAMAAGVTDRLWKIENLVDLLQEGSAARWPPSLKLAGTRPDWPANP